MALAGRIIARNAAETTHSPIPIIGKIRVGEKALTKDGKEYPTSLDYFKPSGRYEREFYEAYGEKPSKLSILFASDDLAVSCFERYECRDKAGKKVGLSDGQTCMVWDSVQGRMVNINPDDPKVKAAGIWRAALTLRFVLPDIQGIFGLWEFTTYGEKSTIPQIRETYDYVESAAGTVRGLPFDLLVEKHKSESPDGKNRSYPVVSLVANLSAANMDKLRGLVAQGLPLPSQITRAYLETVELKELPAASVIDPE